MICHYNIIIKDQLLQIVAIVQHKLPFRTIRNFFKFTNNNMDFKENLLYFQREHSIHQI